MNNQRYLEGVRFLAQQGLNIFAVLECATLPDDVVTLLQSQDIRLKNYSRLVLLAHGGRQLWTAMAEAEQDPEHPVDQFSLTTTKRFIKDYLAAAPTLMLYPTTYSVPLQRLGELAGWSHPSPVGLGINPTYGLWFAYRTAFLTTADLPLTEKQLNVSPCDSCRDKPCVTACPASAVRADALFDIYKCADFRLLEQSVCQDRCLARMACPAATEHRYELEQIQYHYGRSMETIKLYSKGN